MMTTWRGVGALLVVAVLGVVSGEFLCRSVLFRDAMGRLAGRGHLLVVTNGRGIYESDLAGVEEATPADVVVEQNLRRLAATQPIEPSRIDREIALHKAQFADEQLFVETLGSTRLSLSALRDKIGEQLRAVDWLETQIAAGSNVSEEECREFYRLHPELFTQPIRYRAAHLFLAAHAETPPEVIEEKTGAIETFAARLTAGEPLAQLAVEASEDEATKARGGELGFFSQSRMPSDFFVEVEKLHPGETSKPFRSHLGFHIVRLDEVKAARPLSFEEARGEIKTALVNQRRAVMMVRLSEQLGQ